MSRGREKLKRRTIHIRKQMMRIRKISMREKLKVDDVKDEQDCRLEYEVIEDSTEQI